MARRLVPSLVALALAALFAWWGTRGGDAPGEAPGEAARAPDDAQPEVVELASVAELTPDGAAPSSTLGAVRAPIAAAEAADLSEADAAESDSLWVHLALALDGAPLADTEVELDATWKCDGQERTTLRRLRTDALGRASLRAERGGPECSLRVAVACPNPRARGEFPIDAVPPRGDLDLGVVALALADVVVHGVVVDADDRPVAGAWIEVGKLFSAEFDPRPVLAESAETGADGRFALRGFEPPASRWLLRASAPGLVGRLVPIEPDDLPVRVVLAPVGSVRGRIDLPLAGTTFQLAVAVLDPGRPAQSSAATSVDAAGVFELDGAWDAGRGDLLHLVGASVLADEVVLRRAGWSTDPQGQPIARFVTPPAVEPCLVEAVDDAGAPLENFVVTAPMQGRGVLSGDRQIYLLQGSRYSGTLFHYGEQGWRYSAAELVAPFTTLRLVPPFAVEVKVSVRSAEYVGRQPRMLHAAVATDAEPNFRWAIGAGVSATGEATIDVPVAGRWRFRVALPEPDGSRTYVDGGVHDLAPGARVEVEL